MGKELQVSLGVIGVLLIMFLAMVYQRFFLNSNLDTDPIRTSIQSVDSPDPRNLQVNSQPTLVQDNQMDQPPSNPPSNPRQGADNPRNSRPDSSDVDRDVDRDNGPVPARDGHRFTPAPHVER
jgi:hypothetical protein